MGRVVSGRLLRGVLDPGESVEPLSEHVAARFEKTPVVICVDDAAHHGPQLANVLAQLGGLVHRQDLHGFSRPKRIDCVVNPRLRVTFEPVPGEYAELAELMTGPEPA